LNALEEEKNNQREERKERREHKQEHQEPNVDQIVNGVFKKCDKDDDSLITMDEAI